MILSTTNILEYLILLLQGTVAHGDLWTPRLDLTVAPCRMVVQILIINPYRQLKL